MDFIDMTRFYESDVSGLEIRIKQFYYFDVMFTASFAYTKTVSSEKILQTFKLLNKSKLVDLP